MTSKWFDGDEELLEQLGRALAEEGPDPVQAEMLMVGYDIVMGDTLEAALVHDSLIDPTAAVRSTTASSRMITYSLGDIEIEFELTGGRIVGHIDPPPPGPVYLEQPTTSGPTTVETAPDALGQFQFPLRLPATFRLRFRDEDGRSVATGWIDGPHQTLE